MCRSSKEREPSLGNNQKELCFQKQVTNLYKSLVRPHLDYAMQVWSPHLEKYKKIIEKVRDRAAKLIPNLKDLAQTKKAESNKTEECRLAA